MPATQSSYLRSRWLLDVGIVYIFLVWSLAVWDFVEFQKISTCPSSKYNVYHGLMLAFVASAIITLLLLINHRRPSDFVVNAIFLVCVSILFTLLVSLPSTQIKANAINNCTNNIQYKSELDANTNAQQNSVKQCSNDRTRLDQNTVELIKSEHNKAVDEIKQRIQMDDKWFNDKFILLGGILAAFLTFLSQFKSKDSQLSSNERGSEITEHVAYIFKTPVAACVLGMACVVSLAIDLHIRGNAIVVQQLGLWIKDYVECILNQNTDIYVGWETFIRTDRDSGKGLHMDFAYNMVSGAHFYFISVFLYVIYVGCVLFCFSQSRLRGEFHVSIFIFALVHLTLVIVAFGGNSSPSMLQVQLPLWPGRWFSGETSGLLPLLLCLLVSYLTFTRLFTLYKHCSENKGQPQ